MATKASTKANRKTRRATNDKERQNVKTSTAAKSATDALQLLEEDHRKVEELFDEYDEMSGDDQRRGELADQICRELTVHAQIEEEIFYPRAREATKDNELIDEAIVEHASVKHLIKEIEEIEPGEELFDARIRVLEEMVKRHIQEEEEELFPELTAAGMDIDAVGEELARRKQELMAELPE
ncbi:MAG TPA: hemerythrin domain-containing protein [Stellaceae bacterium]|nr:hemerythrin domain-containing protein [Stellaceae bacterium]